MMTPKVQTEKIVNDLLRLSPEQQAAVAEFIDWLKQRDGGSSPFLTAVDEFIGEHSEILRQLAN